MTRARDFQKGKLYKAERIALGHTGDGSELATVEAVQAFVDKVLASAWTRRTFPQCRTRVTVLDGRGRRAACSEGGAIRMPRWSRSRWVTLHELAHEIYDRTSAGAMARKGAAAHGWQFAERYLLLVRHFLGAEAHEKLRAAFKAHRVRYSAPRASRAPSPAALAALARINATRQAAGPPQPGMVRLGKLWIWPAPASASTIDVPTRPAYPPCESDI
jgi:putative metallohydrolase (TIGR04338 family)